MSDEGKALVRRMYDEVWNEGRLDVVDDICASDYVGVGPYGDERGPDAVKRGVAARRAAFPDVRVIRRPSETLGHSRTRAARQIRGLYPS